MSSIFFNIEPKVINTELACLIGLNEAIVLQQLHYWIEKNKATGTNFIDGHVWTYGTLQEYRDRDFRFWSLDTVKRTIGNLLGRGFLIKGNYNRMKMDHTNWYSIDYAAVDEWVSQNASPSDPSPLEMAAQTDEGKMPSSNSADCPHRSVQVAPIDQCKLPPSNGADCPNRTVQNAPNDQCKMPSAIQEIKEKINNKRLTNKTNTQDAAPAAGECVSYTAAVVGEVLDAYELLFNEFWTLYPRKESKQQAKKAWMKLKPDQALFDLIANALEYRRQTKEWLAEGGRYIPHPATWLNGRRWEDEIDQQCVSETAVLEERYSSITVDGKPLDPVQRKQMEFIEKQLRARTNSEASRSPDSEQPVHETGVI
jgi:hypothetical protein